jgi:glucose-6-phosphate dehydrogenase assembly protein OpcA
MWRSAAVSSKQESAVTRASAFTLLVYVEDEAGAREVSNLMAEITEQNPCRAIIMLTEPDASPKELTVAISAHCHIPAAEEKQICSEQITLRARREMGPELASVVLPLTISGLPIFFWWRAGTFGTPPWLNHILRVTDHLIVDSGRFPTPRNGLAQLAAWLAETSGRVGVSDLNWGRATPWRDVLAQCFDSPDRRPYLDRISSVRIEYDVESPRLIAQRAVGLLLGAWLATRLGWDFQRVEQPAADQPRTYYFRSGQREIKFDRALRKTECAGRGNWFSIFMEGGGARFSFTRGADGATAQIVSEVPGAPPLARAVRLAFLEETEILNEELKLARRDHVYEAALGMVARMTAA